MANIMIVLDGLEDISYPSLEGKTPYDHGKGANFLELEAHSAVGRFQTTPDGFEPDTQTCVLTLLGVEPEDIPTGRSYIEARAVGMPVGEDDIIMRCNFVKIAPNGVLEVPTCSAPPTVADALLAEVRALPGVAVRQVGSYKSLQCVSGGRKYLDSMHTFPPHNYAGHPLEELLPSGNELADRLAAFTRSMLERHAPYTVFNWAQAASCSLPSFASLHGGATGAMVSATDAPVGSAVVMGMACRRPDTATGDTDTDLAAKAEAALELARECDVVVLHVGGPDEATHRKDAREKASFVKRMDGELIAPLLRGAPDRTRILLTCDHIALCGTSGHTADPVGFLLYQKGTPLAGNLGILPGTSAVEVLMGRS